MEGFHGQVSWGAPTGAATVGRRHGPAPRRAADQRLEPFLPQDLHLAAGQLGLRMVTSTARLKGRCTMIARWARR